MERTLIKGDRIYPLGPYWHDDLTKRLISYDGAIIARRGNFFHDLSGEYFGVEAVNTINNISSHFRESFVSEGNGLEEAQIQPWKTPLQLKILGIGLAGVIGFGIYVILQDFLR